MKTASQFEKAIQKLKNEGKLHESFQITQFNEGRLVGKDDLGTIILWDQDGTAWLYSMNCHKIKCIIINEDTECPEIVNALTSVTIVNELKID